MFSYKLLSLSDQDPWLQVNLKKLYDVSGMATQGDPANSDWVVTYKIRYSYMLDAIVAEKEWLDYKDNGEIKVSTFRLSLRNDPVF